DASAWPQPRPVLVMLNDESLERVCRAHWPSWERMRPDHQREWRAKMKTALMALWQGDAPQVPAEGVHPNTTKLIRLMTKYELLPREVGDLLGVKANTVRNWRTASATRVIDDNTLELLEFKLRNGKPGKVIES